MKRQEGAKKPEPVRMTVHRADRVLEISYDDGTHFRLPAELLRVESPSAEIQNHGGPKKIPGGKMSVGITGAEAVGHYALKLIFDDGHDSGIYTWDYLYELGFNQKARMQSYLKALEERGLSRN